jgi:hypothetical protein
MTQKALTQLQQNGRIVEDFTSTTLEGLPGPFSRLVYLASLRDLTTGRYEHAGLSVLYPDEAIQQTLEMCHEQIFERILESPLQAQERELKICLKNMAGGFHAAVDHWGRMEAYRVLLPEAAPDYLKELFCSNMRALLALLRQENSTARSDA